MLALTLVIVGALTLLLSVAGVCARSPNRRGGDPLIRDFQRSRQMVRVNVFAQTRHPVHALLRPNWQRVQQKKSCEHRACVHTV